MGFSPGEESLTAAVAAQAIEAQPSSGQIKPWIGNAVSAPNNIFGRRCGGSRLFRTTRRAMRAERMKAWCGKSAFHYDNPVQSLSNYQRRRPSRSLRRRLAATIDIAAASGIKRGPMCVGDVTIGDEVTAFRTGIEQCEPRLKRFPLKTFVWD
jgi:hypothetical protein